MPGLDWERCRSLLAILRSGSLSGAARSLGVSHPTMRRHLEDLEAATGTSLFVRSPTGLAATELALSLREPSETMEAAFEHLVRTASAEAGSLDGTVRITASEIIGVEVLPAILADLREDHPGLIFELHVTDRVEDLLRNDADIAVRMARPVQGDLLARKAATLIIGVFAHRRWIAAHPGPRTIPALVAGGHMIGDDRGALLADGLRASGVAANRSDFAFRSDSTLVQLAALRAGLGVGVCQIALAARDAALVRLLPEISFELEAWLVSHPAQRNLARVGVTLEALARGLARYAQL